MTSQVVQGALLNKGGYGRFRGQCVNNKLNWAFRTRRHSLCAERVETAFIQQTQTVAINTFNDLELLRHTPTQSIKALPKSHSSLSNLSSQR